MTATDWQDQPPMRFGVAVTSSHWNVGFDPAIMAEDLGLAMPSASSARLGSITGTIQAYRYGELLVATTPAGGLIDVSFADKTWRYTGIEGTAQGMVTGIF